MDLNAIPFHLIEVHTLDCRIHFFSLVSGYCWFGKIVEKMGNVIGHELGNLAPPPLKVSSTRKWVIIDMRLRDAEFDSNKWICCLFRSFLLSCRGGVISRVDTFIQAMYEIGSRMWIETREEARLEATVRFSPMKPIYGGWAGTPQPTISFRGFQRERTTLCRFQSKNGESLSRVRITHGIGYHQFSQRKFLFLEQCRL